MSDDQTYSADEVALVLRRLGELQVRDAPDGALTRSELEQAAREAGLDVRNLDTALAELETAGKRGARFAGMRLFVVVRRQVPGSLTQEKLEAAVALINRSIGIIGQHQIVGRALTWFGRHVAVSITEAGPNIEIQIEERFRNTSRGRLAFALGVSVPGGFATLVALANVAMEPLGLLLGLAMPVVSWGLARASHNRGVEATQGQLEVLGDQLAALLRDDGG